ncbi:MAG: ABC transporter permease subunit [Chloroflexi bacterium]|nr:ABC transporter permease subunit [Chloroflexota bacterium]
MAANLELERVKERSGLRGFSNLFRKENRAWWGTRRWWINALLWTGLLCGLTAIMLFVSGEEVNEATEAEITQAGGLIAYILLLGLNIFFQFGVPVLAIGTVILAQDLIIGEKQSGVAEWLLSKPVTRRAYVLAKLAANALGVFALLVGLPSVVAYGMLSLRMGAPFPLAPFLSAVGIMTVHTLFYLTLTLMLGTIFNNRGPILGIALASVLGGGMLGGFIKPLLYVTPWMLPKVALLTATGQAIPAEMGIASLVATALWSVVFIFVAFAKFEKMEC